jgi:nitroreductase
MGNMLLAAQSLGLGACWIHRAKETFEMEEGKAILRQIGLEGEYEGIGNCVVGYPEIVPTESKPRRENRVYYVK